MNLFSEASLDKQLAKTPDVVIDDGPEMVEYEGNPLKKDFIKALRASMGNVSKATDSLNISRTIVYRWAQNDPVFAEKLYEQRERVHDWVESKLFLLIKNLNPAATIFYLKTQCKDRGYVERRERGDDQDPENLGGFAIEVIPISVETIEHAKSQG